MSAYWALAARGAVCAVLAGLASAGAVAYVAGVASGLALLYGVVVGVLVFAAVAASVWIMTVRPSGLRVLFGAGIYVWRLVAAAFALGAPAYYEAWPVAPMVVGFTGVYIVENVTLLAGAYRLGVRRPGAERRVRV